MNCLEKITIKTPYQAFHYNYFTISILCSIAILNQGKRQKLIITEVLKQQVLKVEVAD